MLLPEKTLQEKQKAQGKGILHKKKPKNVLMYRRCSTDPVNFKGKDSLKQPLLQTGDGIPKDQLKKTLSLGFNQDKTTLGI